MALALVAPLVGNAQPALLANDDTVALRLEAPFDDLFAGAKSDPDYTVDGTLAFEEHSPDGTPIPVTIALRGHTSRRESECTFPKLKLTARAGTLPGVGRTLKIGTHCGESSDDELTAKFGRLRNERSPWREAAVYRILRALDIPTLRSQPARITYVFTAADGGAVSGSQTLTRNALLLEDEDDAVERVGGGGDIDADEFTSADKLFAPEAAAALAFAEALIGNFDWCVKFTPDDHYRCDARLKLWNVVAARTGDGGGRPIIYDFDVSGMVAGSHRWFDRVYNAAFVPSKSPRAVEAIGQLQRTRSLFPRALLDATRRRFLERRDAAYQALDASPLDAAGRRHIAEYIDAFFDEISSDDTFCRPAIVEPDTVLRLDSDPGSAAACASRGAAPVGTVVSEPLESREGMVRVMVLDTLWHWAPPARCPAVQHGTVWIPAGAISRDYPDHWAP